MTDRTQCDICGEFYVKELDDDECPHNPVREEELDIETETSSIEADDEKEQEERDEDVIDED